MLKSSFFKLLKALILLLPAYLSLGQVVNDKSHIHVKNGGIFYVSGSFENRSSLAKDTASVVVEGATSLLVVNQEFANNSGLLHLIDGKLQFQNYKSLVVNDDSSQLINQRGQTFVSGDWINDDGIYIDTVTSEFHLNGTTNQDFYQNKKNLFWHVYFEGGGTKTINGHLITNKSEFINGIVKCDVTDTFAITNVKAASNFYASDVIGGSNNSYVEGPMWIKGQTKIDFPIGLGGVYRPLNFSLIPDTVLLKAEVIQNINPTPLLQLEQVLSDFAWSYVTLDSTAFLGSVATVTFPEYDTLGKGLSSGLVVAQGWNRTGDYLSLGNGGATILSSNISLKTSAIPGQAQILAIGSECLSSKLSLLVKLEGAYRGGSYGANSLNVNVLDRFEFGGAGAVHMFQGYSIPTTAVDLIEIYIRGDAAPFNYIDTTIAWATNDGSILNFLTGEEAYVEFCNANIVDTKPYMVEVRHRNHASIMTSLGTPFIASTVIPTVGNELDLTIGSHLYGLNPAKLLGGDMHMYMGNAFSQNNNQEINSLDLIIMINDIQGLLQGYLNTDVNLDGVVNTGDYDEQSCYTCNSLNLKMSSVP